MTHKHHANSDAWRVLLLAFLALYALSVFLLAVGTFGWFGQEQDPLSGALLLPMGLPWNVLADRLGAPGTGALIAAPSINAAILYWLLKR